MKVETRGLGGTARLLVRPALTMTKRERIEKAIEQTTDQRVLRLLNRIWWREWFAEHPPGSYHIDTHGNVTKSLNSQPLTSVFGCNRARGW